MNELKLEKHNIDDSKKLGNIGGDAHQAFKGVANAVRDRQLDANNDLMKLGGGIEPRQGGKYFDPDHICLKPSMVENMFPINKDLNMMVRRN